MKVKVTQSCPTLWDPMDYTVHGILQARILEWVAFPFFRGSSQARDWTQVSCIAADSLPAEPQGSPSILEWAAYPFSSRSSRPRNQTRISCIVGGFFTNWAIREAQSIPIITLNLHLLFYWYKMRIVVTFCHIELLYGRQCMVHLMHLTQWMIQNKHSATFTTCIP